MFNRTYKDEEAGLSAEQLNAYSSLRRQNVYKELVKGDNEYIPEQMFQLNDTDELKIDDETALQILERCDLKAPKHLYELRMKTIEDDVYVQAESESINFVSFHFESISTLDKVSFVCQNFYENGGRYLARNLTQMPENKMISLIYCLVFSPMVQLQANPTNDFYEKIRLENSDSNVFYLPYALTASDISDVDSLRLYINKTLCCSSGVSQYAEPEMNEFMKRLIERKRFNIEKLKKIALMKNDHITFADVKHRAMSALPCLPNVPGFEERFKLRNNKNLIDVKKSEPEIEENNDNSQDIDINQEAIEGERDVEEVFEESMQVQNEIDINKLIDQLDDDNEDSKVSDTSSDNEEFEKHQQRMQERQDKIESIDLQNDPMNPNPGQDSISNTQNSNANSDAQNANPFVKEMVIKKKKFDVCFFLNELI